MYETVKKTWYENAFGRPPEEKTRSPLKNIWEAGRCKGRAKKEITYSDKPFGSKYYYAHNNPNANGGYKDGLKIEDYRMNGPRLLSRNGLPVEGQLDNEASLDRKTKEKIESQQVDVSVAEITKRPNGKSVTQDSNLRNITKYFWDDPGDSSGIATIRIDVLPGDRDRPGDSIGWKSVKVKTVRAALRGEGLLVQIQAESPEEVLYQLKISKLYGDAADVKCVAKLNRLLVKIYKKKSYLAIQKGSNLDAWPQPHRKI